MKKTILFIITILVSITLLGQAEIKLDKKTIKFSKTKEGVELKHRYKLTNTGNAPLFIDRYDVACTCTKAKFPKTPILPNQTVDIIVTFDTNHKIGWQDRIITLYSNAENSPTKIRFKVMVDNKK